MSWRFVDGFATANGHCVTPQGEVLVQSGAFSSPAAVKLWSHLSHSLFQPGTGYLFMLTIPPAPAGLRVGARFKDSSSACRSGLVLT